VNKVVFFLLVVLAQFTFAQQDTTFFKLLKVSPLHVFDLDNGISLAFENSKDGIRSFQLEAGYGHSDANLWLTMDDFADYEQFGGYQLFRVRAEWRKYFKKPDTKPPGGLYYAFDFLGKHVFKNEDLEVGRQPIAGQPQYFEKVEGKVKKTVGGFHFKIGNQIPLNSGYSDKTDWYLDLFAGLGFRVVYNSFTYPFEEASDQINTFNVRSLGTIITRKDRPVPVVSGAFGLKIGKIL
jgi:hypothetical protein